MQVSEQEAREFLAKPRQDSAAGLVEWIVDVTNEFCAGAMSADVDEKCRLMMLVSFVVVLHCDPLCATVDVVNSSFRQTVLALLLVCAQLFLHHKRAIVF